MHVVCLLGSPRRDGNSAALTARLTESLRAAGATVSNHLLDELDYAGCRNLFACKTVADTCGQHDDLTPVLADVAEADIVVMATPVYFADMSGQLKLAIDRMFSFLLPGYPSIDWKSRLPERADRARRLVWIQTQGESETMYGDLFERMKRAFGFIGFQRFDLVHAAGVREVGDALRQPALLGAVDGLARNIIDGDGTA